MLTRDQLADLLRKAIEQQNWAIVEEVEFLLRGQRPLLGQADYWLQHVGMSDLHPVDVEVNPDV